MWTSAALPGAFLPSLSSAAYRAHQSRVEKQTHTQMKVIRSHRRDAALLTAAQSHQPGLWASRALSGTATLCHRSRTALRLSFKQGVIGFLACRQAEQGQLGELEGLVLNSACREPAAKGFMLLCEPDTVGFLSLQARHRISKSKVPSDY